MKHFVFNGFLQPKQRELLRIAEETDYTIIGDGGSKGSAKSHGLRSVMLLRRLKYPGTAGLIFRRKYKQLVETHLEAGYFKQWPFMREWYKESKKTIFLPNGSRIVLGYAENPTDIDDFQGHEYMDVMIDEAARCTEQMLIKLNETRRWTGRFGGKSIPDTLCKTYWFMNPGGPGHNYIRRLMYKEDFHGKERKADYKFLQAFAWDNIEWARASLAEDGYVNQDGTPSDCQGQACGRCGTCVYYSWTDLERRVYFISRTERGHQLDSLPPRLRIGWLEGKWDEFAGQFYDIFDPAKHVKRCQPEKGWYPRWLGIDWGFQHPMSCHWNARVQKVTKVYREHVANLHSARAQAQEIVDKTPEEERKLIDAIYLSPDAFQKRSEQDSFAELMGEVFVRYGMPFPTRADDDRVHGAQCMYDLLRDNELEIDPCCPRLIETIPMICTEEDDPEEIEKFDGDDPWDSERYALKSRMRAGLQPAVEAAQDQVAAFAKSKGKEIEDLEINTLAQLSRRALVSVQHRRAGRRGGLGRIWRPQN